MQKAESSKEHPGGSSFVTLGLDHGTLGIRGCVLGDARERLFELGRAEARTRSILTEVEKHVDLDKIELVAIAYSMGDAIDKITDIRNVRDRGATRKTTGEFVGGGTRVYDEIKTSSLPAVVIPGLHRGIVALDERFRALYSHCAAADKVSLAYHAFKKVGEGDILISDISSNTVTIAIKNSRFFGAIDACLGAPGILQGPLDLGAIRDIDDGKSANKTFYRAGIARICGAKDASEILEPKSESANLALESLILAAKMEISSFLAVIEPKVIVITGAAGTHASVFKPLEKEFSSTARMYGMDAYSAARGSAEIARDILKGEKDFLGIGVDFAQ